MIPQSHLVLLIVFSALVSIVFAGLMRESSRDRVRFGLMTFAGFTLSAIVAGWLMYPLPG